MVTIEFAKGKIIVSEEEYLKTSQRVHDNFISKQKGFKSWEILKDNGGLYIDLLHWKTLKDAQKAAKLFMEHPIAEDFMKCFDMESLSMQHFEVIKRY